MEYLLAKLPPRGLLSSGNSWSTRSWNPNRTASISVDNQFLTAPFPTIVMTEDWWTLEHPPASFKALQRRRYIVNYFFLFRTCCHLVRLLYFLKPSNRWFWPRLVVLYFFGNTGDNRSFKYMSFCQKLILYFVHSETVLRKCFYLPCLHFWT